MRRMKEKQLHEVCKWLRRIQFLENTTVRNGNEIYFPFFPLPKKYNRTNTRLLLKFHKLSDYASPDAYVDRDIQLAKGSTHHIDEALTEDEMLKQNYVKLCIKITNWHNKRHPKEFVLIVFRFLLNLRADR